MWHFTVINKMIGIFAS